MFQNGVQTVHPSCQLFLTDTGWHLSFSELFGENEEKALARLKTFLKDWCVTNGLPDVIAEEINAEFLFNRFGISEDSFLICLEPFSLSASVPQSYVVSLPLNPFSELFN